MLSLLETVVTNVIYFTVEGRHETRFITTEYYKANDAKNIFIVEISLHMT